MYSRKLPAPSSSLKQTQHSLPPRRPGAMAVHTALAVLAALPLLPAQAQVSVVAAAQASPQVKTYRIGSGPLAAVLGKFAAAAGVALSFDPAIAAGHNSAGLQGSHSLASGFAALLGGAGLQAVDAGNGAYTLRGAPAAAAPGAAVQGAGAEPVLATINVSAARGSATDGSGSYAAGPASMATGLNLALRATPQTVTVITRQQMDDQGSVSVSDVMRQAPGVTVMNYDSERWSFNARGFPITNFQYDGVSKVYDGVYDWGATNSDMTIYDRVEMVKGATGLMSGSGDPSATINLIRKLPGTEFAGALKGSAGSWRNGRVELDLSGPLNASASVRGRVVAAHQDRESFLDHYRQKKTVLYGVLEADLAPGTKLTAGADYQKLDPRGSSWTGFPIFNSDGTRTDWSRSFNPATTWSRREMETRNLFATLDHQLANGWQFKLNASTQHAKHRSLLGSASGGNPNPLDGSGMYLFMGDFSGDRTQNTVNASLGGNYQLGGRTHQAMLGAMWSDTKTDGPWSDSLYPGVPGAIFNWQGNFAQPDFPPNARYDQHNRQKGLYGATRLRLSEPLSLIVGSRLSWVDGRDQRIYADAQTAPIFSSQKENRVVTPYTGVVYDLDDTYSLYGSYTSIFQPQEFRDVNRQYLPAVEGRSVEAGIKGAYLGGRVNATLALFQIKQDNVAENVGFVNGESQYRAVDGVTSKGVEAEVGGQLGTGWNLQAGYAYTHARDAQGVRVYGSTLMASQPEHALRLNSSYRLPGAWNALTVGGGLSWQSAFHGKVWNPVAGDYAIVRQQSYALANAMLRYRLNGKVSAELHVNNLFDKKYMSGLGLFETGFYGEPRNATLTLNYAF